MMDKNTLRELIKKIDRERIADMRRRGASLSTIVASRWCIRDKDRRAK
jgi:transcription initiation factor IIE alpha subunit